MPWTTPEELVSQVRRRWDDGCLLAAPLRGETLFPLRLRFSSPSPRELRERFSEARTWIEGLRLASRPERGFGFELEWTEQNNRQLGRNRVPAGAVVPTEEDALRLIGRKPEALAFRRAAATTLQGFPGLAGWLVRRPRLVLEHQTEWDRILAVLRWFEEHPRPELYLRQLDIAGADTKFIESHAPILSELLELVLPPEAVERDAGPGSFAQRFGLLAKPIRLRFRLLDGTLWPDGLQDVSAPVAQLARLPLTPERVFITENEINGLAFPPLRRSLVVFGLGYGVDRLDDLPWLRGGARVWYWGDIDTHGFAMLDRVRAIVPEVRSFLMDRPTLVAHEAFWVREAAPYRGTLTRLSPAEASLLEDLQLDRLGKNVRLEQERIPFSKVQQALEALLDDE